MVYGYAVAETGVPLFALRSIRRLCDPYTLANPRRKGLCMFFDFPHRDWSGGMVVALLWGGLRGLLFVIMFTVSQSHG